jgi:hypothetical protein
VTLAEDVPQIRLIIERVRVFGCVAGQAHRNRGLQADVRAGRIFDVQAAGPVALLALHVLQALVFDHFAATGLTKPRDVTADAGQVVLLVGGDQGVVAALVDGGLPQRERLFVAVGAGLDPDVARRAGGR